MPAYPSEITPTPLPHGRLIARVGVPGSKSLTNRALIVAALGRGTSTLTGALESDDTRVMIEALRALGFRVDHDSTTSTIVVEGRGGLIPSDHADLFVGNSGTTLRFLTPLVTLGNGVYRLDGVSRMRERPVADLLLSLNRLGADARSEFGTGCPPVVVRASGLDGGYADVAGDVSSQFLSGLLMVLPLARGPSTIEVRGRLVSQPYVAMTLEVMRAFGITVAHKNYRRFQIIPSTYMSILYAIEPDATAASYWFAAAAITGGAVTVDGLGSSSIQGDMAFVDVLQHMGCRVDRSQTETTVRGGPLRGVDVDMNAISDTVMTLAAVALFAEGVTRIRNIGHIRHKETDRIAALAAELRKLGATVDELEDGLLIIPPDRLQGTRIATYDDHRIAMAFAIAAMGAEGITIENPGCVAKTYPSFWDELGRLSTSIV